MARKTVVNINNPLDNKKNKNFFDTPNSPTLDLMQKGISNSKDLGLMVERQRAISHYSDNSERQMELFKAVVESNNKIKIRQTTENYTTEITFIFSALEQGLPQPAKKLLRFLCTKINEQAFSNHELRQDYIQFNLQEIVDSGLYKSLDTARRGFKEGTASLLNIQVEGSRTEGKGKRQTNYEWTLGHLFRRAYIKNGSCYVLLETVNDWNFIISQYEIMPNYCYLLSNRTFDLTEAVFYLARVNTSSIAKTGSFNISFKVIQQRLALPEDSINPTRDIKNPILDSIKELNEKEAETKDFKIEAFYDNNLPIKDWIESGYITVYFYNDYLENYKNMASKKEAKIERAVKAKEKSGEKSK